VHVQHEWALSDRSTWASQEAAPLSKTDQRMLLASLAPSNPGAFQPHAAARESIVNRESMANCAAAAPPRASTQDSVPMVEAWASVQAFLRSPADVAQDHQSDISSHSAQDDDDCDIPDALILDTAVASRCSSARSAWQASRPHTAGQRPRLTPSHTCTASGAASGPGPAAGLPRPHTAHAGALTPQARLRRRLSYKPPKPHTDEVTGFKRAAQARFRT
jgi:hypothetical protein